MVPAARPLVRRSADPVERAGASRARAGTGRG
jgi:hypothetical protein